MSPAKAGPPNCPGLISRCVLVISKDGDYTTSLGNLFSAKCQVLVTGREKSGVGTPGVPRCSSGIIPWMQGRVRLDLCHVG